MHEIVPIPIADLLVYPKNARLKEEQQTQQATLLSLAKQQGNRLLKLAKDIVENGVDPSALPIVVPTSDQKKRYMVLEGNRRVTVLKGLETPPLILAAFDGTGQKRFSALAKRYATSPINELNCVLFESEEDADHWIDLRHTGQNEGAGLVEWGSEEKDRYASRHKTRSPAGQVLEFVDKFGTLSEKAAASNREIITSLTRLLSTPQVRAALGVDIVQGDVIQLLPSNYVARTLSRVVDDLMTGELKVGDIYNRDQRLEFARKLTTEFKPEATDPLPIPTVLGQSAPPTVVLDKKKKRKGPEKADRTACIPNTCILDIDPPRINAIYNELMGMSVDQYPNACSVLMRVFLELSVDHYIAQSNLMTEEERRSSKLAVRIKTASPDLLAKGRINQQLETAIKKIADSQFIIAATAYTFNQYVHNAYVFPKPSELRIAWDELQPFMEALWQ